MNIFHSFQIRLAIKKLESLSQKFKYDQEQEYQQAQEPVIRSLVKIGKPAVTPLLTVLLQSTRMRVQNSIIKTLGQIGDSRAVDPIIRIIKEDHHSAYKREAAIALGQIGGKGSLEALKSLVNEGTSASPTVWRAAAASYEKISGENLDSERNRLESYWERLEREARDKEEFERWHQDGSSLL